MRLSKPISPLTHLGRRSREYDHSRRTADRHGCILPNRHCGCRKRNCVDAARNAVTVPLACWLVSVLIESWAAYRLRRKRGWMLAFLAADSLVSVLVYLASLSAFALGIGRTPGWIKAYCWIYLCTQAPLLILLTGACVEALPQRWLRAPTSIAILSMAGLIAAAVIEPQATFPFIISVMVARVTVEWCVIIAMMSGPLTVSMAWWMAYLGGHSILALGHIRSHGLISFSVAMVCWAGLCYLVLALYGRRFAV